MAHSIYLLNTSIPTPSLSSDQTNNIINKVIDSSGNNAVVLLAVLGLVGFIIFLPYMYKMGKENKTTNSALIEIIQQNNTAITGLKEAMSYSMNSSETKMGDVQEIVQATYNNLTTTVNHQIQIDKYVSRLMSNTANMSNIVDDIAQYGIDIREYQTKFNENQDIILKMLTDQDVRIADIETALQKQFELLEDLNKTLERIVKKIATPAKKTTTKKTTKKVVDDEE